VKTLALKALRLLYFLELSNLVICYRETGFW
jgi:hypothetical protein